MAAAVFVGLFTIGLLSLLLPPPVKPQLYRVSPVGLLRNAHGRIAALRAPEPAAAATEWLRAAIAEDSTTLLHSARGRGLEVGLNLQLRARQGLGSALEGHTLEALDVWGDSAMALFQVFADGDRDWLHALMENEGGSWVVTHSNPDGHW